MLEASSDCGGAPETVRSTSGWRVHLQMDGWHLKQQRRIFDVRERMGKNVSAWTTPATKGTYGNVWCSKEVRNRSRDVGATRIMPRPKQADCLRSTVRHQGRRRQPGKTIIDPSPPSRDNGARPHTRTRTKQNISAPKHLSPLLLRRKSHPVSVERFKRACRERVLKDSLVFFARTRRHSASSPPFSCRWWRERAPTDSDAAKNDPQACLSFDGYSLALSRNATFS